MLESIEKDLKLLPQQQAKKSSTTSSSSSLSKSTVDSLLDLTNEVDSITGYKEESIGRGSGSCPSLDFIKPLHNSTSKSFGVGLGHVTNAVIDTKLVVEEKCKNVYLGDDIGGSSSFGARALPCLKLRCTACDFNVLRFVGQCWSDKVNYLFFRNNFPDQGKLSKSLESSSKTTTSYCCQCSWLTVEKKATSMILSGQQSTGAAFEGLLMIRRGAIALSGTSSINRELTRSGTNLVILGGTIQASTSFSNWVCGFS